MSKSVAIVTGASQGIGKATAIRLARDFSALVLVARDRANLEQTAEAVRAAGTEALIIDIDLAQPSAARLVVDQTLQAFDRIDALLQMATGVGHAMSDASVCREIAWSRVKALTISNGRWRSGWRKCRISNWRLVISFWFFSRTSCYVSCWSIWVIAGNAPSSKLAANC